MPEGAPDGSAATAAVPASEALLFLRFVRWELRNASGLSLWDGGLGGSISVCVCCAWPEELAHIMVVLSPRFCRGGGCSLVVAADDSAPCAISVSSWRVRRSALRGVQMLLGLPLEPVFALYSTSQTEEQHDTTRLLL